VSAAESVVGLAVETVAGWVVVTAVGSVVLLDSDQRYNQKVKHSNIRVRLSRIHNRDFRGKNRQSQSAHR